MAMKWIKVPGYRCVLTGALAVAAMTAAAEACTRAVYLGPNDQIVTGRSMDWHEDLHSNLWLFPRGMRRSSGVPGGELEWTSRYGSVITSAYEIATTDGMNEAGLVANLLYLTESEYSPDSDSRPALVTSIWAQYMLDNFATVEEAVADARRGRYRMVTVEAPGGKPGTVHLSLSDPSGDSAIFEYIGGELVIHHGREFQVMTNSPAYEQQIALNEYWKQIGGTVMLPGTNRAADRFARASFYINACEQTDNPREAVAATLSVIRNASVPRGITTPDQPNISSTIWRTASDQKNLVYYFEDTAKPGVLWVRLKELDFAEGAGARKITLHKAPDIGGDQTDAFKPAEPFTFIVPE
ncbi:MAG: linear amide C-N hydrolase [Phycisphaerales bacterium]|nr:linear amide C-N hydrolase [Phycisphaerales bacterium]